MKKRGWWLTTVDKLPFAWLLTFLISFLPTVHYKPYILAIQTALYSLFTPMFIASIVFLLAQVPFFLVPLVQILPTFKINASVKAFLIFPKLLPSSSLVIFLISFATLLPLRVLELFHTCLRILHGFQQTLLFGI